MWDFLFDSCPLSTVATHTVFIAASGNLAELSGGLTGFKGCFHTVTENSLTPYVHRLHSFLLLDKTPTNRGHYNRLPETMMMEAFFVLGCGLVNSMCDCGCYAETNADPSSSSRPSTASSQWWNRTLSRTQTCLTRAQVWGWPGWVMPQSWLKWTDWISWQIQSSARGPHLSSSWDPKDTEAPPALWNRFSTSCF